MAGMSRHSPGRGGGANKAGGGPARYRQPAPGEAAPVAVASASYPGRALRKGVLAMIYGEPETSRFLAAVQRLKRLQLRKARQTRLAKQRVRAVLRKMRDC